MTEFSSVERRRLHCFRCGQLMFEYYRSPDGHFGVADPLDSTGGNAAPVKGEVRCLACGMLYRLLDRISPLGHPVERK